MIKWSMFALLLWLGIAALCATAEYAWIGDPTKSSIDSLWEGWNVIGTIIGAVGILGTIIAGSRGARVATLVAGIAVIISLRNVMTFNFPTIFHDQYIIVRWILLLAVLAIFIIPLLWSMITGGGTPSE